MKEQIEKMANDIEKSHWKIVQDFMGCHINSEEMAEHLYNAGYRKQSEGENISQMHPSDEFICEKCGLIIRECCRYEIDEDDGDEICYEFPYRFCPRCGMKVKGGAE